MKILIICSGNTCRSPMGAGLLMMIATSREITTDVRTAGLNPHPGKRVAENAVTVMKELGIDISNEYSKPVTPDMLVRMAPSSEPLVKINRFPSGESARGVSKVVESRKG